MAKPIPFTIPGDLELFKQAEADLILRIGKTTRLGLIRAGKLAVVNVGGNKLITGRSVRAYLTECAANPRPTGRSLGAQRTNARTRSP